MAAMKVDYEQVIKERDAAQRLFAQAQDQLDSVVRQCQDLKVERDLAVEQLQQEYLNRANLRLVTSCVKVRFYSST
jgi:hypothetical protein